MNVILLPFSLAILTVLRLKLVLADLKAIKIGACSVSMVGVGCRQVLMISKSMALFFSSLLFYLILFDVQ